MAKKKRGPGRPPGSKNKPKVAAKKATPAKKAPVKAKPKKKAAPAPARQKREYYKPEPRADLPMLSAADMARIEREMFAVDSPSDLPDIRDVAFPDGSEVNDSRTGRESSMVREAQNQARFELLVNRMKQLEQAFIELAGLVQNSKSSMVGGFGTPRGF